MSWPAFTPMQTALVALLPKRGAVSTAALAGAAAVSLPNVHVELRPLIDVGAVSYDGERDEYTYTGGQP